MTTTHDVNFVREGIIGNIGKRLGQLEDKIRENSLNGIH